MSEQEDRGEARKLFAQEVTDRPGRYLVSTGTKYEFQFGYSRAVRHGNVVRLSGTAGLGEDGVVVSDDVSGQLRRALEIMRETFAELGADLRDVIMTRIYLADMKDADTAAVVHGEAFRDIRPATTIVKTEFVDRRILVEIEAEAVYGGADDKASSGTGRQGG
jgi:enamine deaminase RidA (YjgF/YER057c/UK114 family)